MSRLYFLRKLRSFNVCRKMSEIFYQSVVASAIFFAAVCWGSSIRASDTNRLDKTIKKAGSVLGLKLESFESVVERRTLKNCFPSLTMISTLSITQWSDSGAPSLTGCSSSAVEGTDTGSPSCHMPSHCTITANNSGHNNTVSKHLICCT